MNFKKHISLNGFFILIFALSCYAHTAFTKMALKNSIQLNEKPYSKNKKEFLKDSIAETQTRDRSLTLITKEDEDLTPIISDTTTLEALTYENTTAAQNVTQNDLSCTCGIFLSSQFVKGSAKPPKGEPIISVTLEKQFLCNAIGQKQCQTKCLEQIVKHLPNSASILCASLNRDIRKERAFLFVRNCSSKWYNTNLTAGREYCCKNGLPYNCPKK